MNIEDFEKPEQHPFDMLRGYRNAFEKEAVLMLVLRYAYDEGDLNAARPLKYEHPEMVDDGLLERVNKHSYRLTKKSIGLLYSVYGR